MNVDSTTKPENFKIYCSGNRLINKDGSANGITYNNWDGITVKSGIGITKDNLYSASPFQIDNSGENLSTAGTCESAAASYDHVIDFAGNGIAPNKRTAIDQQCANETKSGTGSCSGTAAYNSSVTDLNKYSIKCGVTYSYPSAVLKKEITDSDNDGMDDSWELARGLDPTNPTDYKGDYCDQGYMNIEYYINDLTANSFPSGTVELSPEQSTPPTPAVSAFETIEAESFASQEGIQIEDLVEGGQNIGFVENGDWVMYRKVDFGQGARSFKAKLSGNAAGIELYTDSLSGTPAATIQFSGTSGFNDYHEIEANIPTITGTHNLYIKFTGGEGYLLNADSFIFSEKAIPLNGRLFKNVEVAFHCLVVADLHQRSLHVGITSQRGCQLTHRTAHRSTQGENWCEMALGYRWCRNANLLQLTGNTHHTGTSHLIIFPCHLHILLHPSTIGGQQLLAFHLLSGRLTLLISGKVFPLQRKNISILYRSNNLTFSDLLSFLHVNILHHATHQ